MLVSIKDYEITLDESTGNMTISGKACEADVVHGNGRRFPESILKPEFKRLKQIVDEGLSTIPIYSEKEHPVRREADVVTERTVGYVSKMRWVDSTKTGFVTITLDASLPKGRELIDQIKSGKKSVGVSQRANGTLDESGTTATSLKIFTFDVVEFPSCTSCRLSLDESVVDMFEIEDDFSVIADEGCSCRLNEKQKDYIRDHIENAVKELIK